METSRYNGGDLGAVLTEGGTRFRVFAPTAESVKLCLFHQGRGGEAYCRQEMERSEGGTWYCFAKGCGDGIYYTYLAAHGDGTVKEAVDPYARALGVNGMRGMVVDLKAAAPEGWKSDTRPPLAAAADAVVYELHVRDMSSRPDSGIRNVGKYLGLTEIGTVNPDGLSTGLDHMKELGITHVQLLPVYDYGSVDEAAPMSAGFNWGYDPVNYNAPEGSYATDPFRGAARIREFRQMIQSLHRAGIRVVMDVVYNHTYDAASSNFEKLVPGYYYRSTDASGCGNETASERGMMQKFMIDSVLFWVEEYHIDGFRFDLMGIHDIGTMREIRQALDEVDSSILLYGEGWTCSSSVLPEEYRALKKNMAQLPGVGAFNDDLRDAVKGSVFEAAEGAFVNGGKGMEETLRFGIAGAVKYPGLDFKKIKGMKSAWAAAPSQALQYVSAHDNLTLWDKLRLVSPSATEQELIRENLLAAAVILTSQGIPFFQAGEEFLRSKPLPAVEDAEEELLFDENSFRSPDTVNGIKWGNKTKYQDVFRYYRGLIALRKAHTAFRYMTKDEVSENLSFYDRNRDGVVSFLLTGKKDGREEALFVIHNANKKCVTVELPVPAFCAAGGADSRTWGTLWTQFVDEHRAGTDPIREVAGKTVTVAPVSCAVFVSTDIDKCIQM